MIRSLLFSWLLFATASAAGLAHPDAASYRIVCDNGFAGSATGIADHIAVTNAHVATQLGGRVRLSHGVTSETSPGYVIGRYAAYDVALIRSDAPISFVKVSPTFDDSAEAEKYGYGGTGKLARIPCRLVSRVDKWLKLSTPSISGDSGGGLFQAGKLVGVVWGSSDTSGRDTNGTSMAAEAKHIQSLACAIDEKRGTDYHEQIFGFG